MMLSISMLMIAVKQSKIRHESNIKKRKKTTAYKTLKKNMKVTAVYTAVASRIDKDRKSISACLLYTSPSPRD